MSIKTKQTKDYKKITMRHPTLQNRKISVIFVDNKLDMPSFSFLVEEARSGGRQGTISGQETHGVRVYKIIELYQHLDSLGISWQSAEEEDIRIIRNFMLCWDMNDALIKNGYYEHEPIKNDTMNQKLSTWFKFFRHQEKRKVSMRMVMTTTMVKVHRPDHFFNHTMGFNSGERTELVERWSLYVSRSPQRMHYPAISRMEFEAFRTQLRKLDVVYEAIAVFMVETGLRIDAALKTDHNVFQNWLKHLSQGGLDEDECIPIEYINKGGETKVCDLPLRAIRTIQTDYRASEHVGRLYDYQEKWNGDDEPMWLRKDGKRIQKWDIRVAFKKASIAMGRTINRISPHHLRHTFATWTVIDTCQKNHIPLDIIGMEPHPLLLSTLMGKLGHASSSSTLRYTLTAFKMTNSGSSGPAISAATIQKSKAVRQIIEEQALADLGNKFNPDTFDHIEYGKELGFAVEYL